MYPCISPRENPIISSADHLSLRQDRQENNNQNAEKNQQDENNSQSSKEIVLRVLMHCEGCKSKVSKCLKGVEGIEDVTVDYANQRVVVKGKKANPLKVLERLQNKYSSNAELISQKPKPENKDKKEPQKKEEPQPQVKVVILKMLMHCEGCANTLQYPPQYSSQHIYPNQTLSDDNPFQDIIRNQYHILAVVAGY